ncbi:MAG: asparagine synthase (glutamine-hydrolyzing) [Deltaproteobacteria bacterium]|nr:asparagine synthase (glutamine-hydrolyzing) [Deltaproteobacteria bacterium]
MCGIAAIYAGKKTGPDLAAACGRMIATLRHRGPDQSGVYCDPSVGLAHARLSIIDLTTGGQPIHNEDQTVWIVYNGEVFNYLELRQDLESRGHHFYTHTDTEVIVHSYEEKGIECLKDFNGQFAFALWDTKKQRLFLARDRVGICPLFYAQNDGVYVVASEIKALIASKILPKPEIDPFALDQVFTLWTTLPGATIFKNIYEVKPGHALIIDTNTHREHRYWDIPYAAPDEHSPAPLEDLCEQVLALLMNATKLRLRADVPVGSYLSGGLDSSGITALIARHFNTNVQTFAIRFQEHDFDEGEYQNEMVAHLKVQHREIEAGNELIAESVPAVVWHAEKPLLRTAPVPMFLLSRFVQQQGIKVVCTGEGADEVFGGYDIFREALVKRFIARQPQSAIRPVLLEQLYPQIFKNDRQKAAFRNFILHNSSDVENPLYSHLIRWENTSRIKQFFSKELADGIGAYSTVAQCMQLLPENFNQRDTLSKAQYLEDAIFLSNYLLSSQGDRMAMAHSLEIRPPYLDHRLFEFMSRVSPQWKVLGINEKHLLKKVFKDVLPSSITQRTKHPYRAPIQPSFLKAIQSGYVRELLSVQELEKNKFFDHTKVHALLKKIEAGVSTSETEGMALMGLISTQLLHEQFVENFSYPDGLSVHWDMCFDRRKTLMSN